MPANWKDYQLGLYITCTQGVVATTAAFSSHNTDFGFYNQRISVEMIVIKSAACKIQWS